MANVKVNNVPDYAREYKYWVVRNSEGELWFYGAWQDKETAYHVATLVNNGLVVEKEDMA